LLNISIANFYLPSVCIQTIKPKFCLYSAPIENMNTKETKMTLREPVKVPTAAMPSIQPELPSAQPRADGRRRHITVDTICPRHIPICRRQSILCRRKSRRHRTNGRLAILARTLKISFFSNHFFFVLLISYMDHFKSKYT
jgi:hypothetical protein